MIGQTVSHYRILAKLGEGGMGVVYKAADTKLDRLVALKFLPSALATREDTKKRFIQEAKATSSFDHPNICTIFEINETSDGQMFISMPFYDGETLQERIARGPVAIDEAIDIVHHLASGLAKAHEEGIVHRDIKPGNILLTKDGQVKIVDFGLAKLATETRLTKTGSTLGTVAYMSPEQARGDNIDGRSDLFSLGVVFYELLTGTLPFKGDHEGAIIYGIMHNDPEPLRSSRSDVPDGLQQVMDRTLSKDVGARYQTAREFKGAFAELGWVGTSESISAPRTGAVSRSPGRRWLPWVLLGGVVAAIAIFVMRDAIRSPSTDSSQTVSATHTQLTFTGDATEPIISPDGQFVAYLRETDNQKELLVRDVGGGEPIVLLDGITEYYNLRWSPDSSKLVLAGGRRGDGFHIYIMPRLGGSVRQLEYYMPYAVWSPDGERLAVSSTNGKRVSFIDVSTEKVDDHALDLEFPFTWLFDLDWSPKGSRLLLHVSTPEEDGHEIWTVGVDGGDPVRVVTERTLSSPRWAPSGESIYYEVPRGATQALWRVGVDPRSGKVTGEPTVLLSGVTGLGPLAFSSDGKLFTYARHLADRDLWLFPTDEEGEGGAPDSRRLTTGTAIDDWPSVSPDGTEIAFVRVMGEATNIFVVPIEGGPARQVTFMDSECFSPVWSPDGREIAFGSYESGKGQVWKVSADGGGVHVFENTRVPEGAALAWAPGERILYNAPGGRNVIILDPVSGGQSPLVANEDVGYLFIPVISPDRKLAATTWNRAGTDEDGVWLISLVDSTQSPVSMGHKHPCGWSGDGQWIYYHDMPRISRVRTDGSEDEVVLTIPFEDVDMHPHLAMSPGAKYLVLGGKVKTPSDIWFVENFDPGVQ